jgi:hypothetical protein
VFSFGYGEDDDKESDVLNVKERHLSEPLPRAVRRDPRAFPRRPESEPAQAASPRSVTAAAAPPPSLPLPLPMSLLYTPYVDNNVPSRSERPTSSWRSRRPSWGSRRAASGASPCAPSAAGRATRPTAAPPSTSAPPSASLGQVSQRCPAPRPAGFVARGACAHTCAARSARPRGSRPLPGRRAHWVLRTKADDCMDIFKAPAPTTYQVHALGELVGKEGRE